MTLFEPPFFVAIQQLVGIFLAVQTSQNAHRLNAIKQPFEHCLTAIYTPLPLLSFSWHQENAPAPVFQQSSRPFYPLFRVFRQSFHVLLTPTFLFRHFLAHVVAFRSFFCILTHRPPFRALYVLVFPFNVPALPSGHKKATAAVPFQHPAVAIISTFSPLRLNLIQLSAVQS